MVKVLQEFVMAILLAALLLGVVKALGVIPFGNEPIETPWRIVLCMLIGLLIGVSAGFSWLQNRKKGVGFHWPVFLAASVAAGALGLEVSYCLESEFASIYSVPVTILGSISLGVLLGAGVRTAL
jgi:hypothetical protein